MSASVRLFVALVLSAVFVVVGVALLSLPAALIVLGLFGVALSLLFVEVGDA